MLKEPGKRITLIPALVVLLSLSIPLKSVFAEKLSGPPYPNLESVSFKSSPINTYTKHMAGGLVPSYFFPELQNHKLTTLDDYGPMDMIDGSFTLSGETGPDGNITGSFTYSGVSVRNWEDGSVDVYEITANGQVTHAYAAFDDKEYLRVMGAAHYQRKQEFSGPVTITMKYTTLVWDDDAQEQVQISGTASAQAQLAFVSCISDLEEINLCYFEAGKGYGDYGFEAAFISPASDQFVWFNNLDYEFGLISGIDFDPEAHHKLTPGAEEGQTQEEIYIDPAYLDKPEKAEELNDDPSASFSTSLACAGQVYPEDGLNCSLSILGGQENQPYTVNWIMDGYVIKSSTILLGQDNFAFPNPPPGDHAVQTQTIDQSTNNVRVSNSVVEILVPPGFDKIDPWAQAAAGAGSVMILGAWLWAEWASARSQAGWMEKMQERFDELLGKQRGKWYEKQMALNDEVKARQSLRDLYQTTCEKEWKRFRSELLNVIDQHHKSDYLIDLYDDMHSDVYQNGQWDGKQLMRLEELVNTHLKMDRQLEVNEEWKRQIEFLNERQKEFSDLMGSWTAMGAEVVAGILTGGASEMVFMPTRAIGNALYASKRAELLGKTGWEATKSVMVESGVRLGADYLFSKAGEKVVGKFIEYGGKGAKRLIGTEGVEAVSEWWQRTSSKFSGAPKLDADLPVIKQNWGKGPQVFVNKPIFKPGKMPPVDLGMENYLNNRIRPLSSELADDMGRMFREGVEIDPNLNNILKAGERYTLSASDEVAVRLMNNPAYKQAVRDGLVPSSAQQAVYQARDKICKNAIQETFEQLDHYVIDGKSASSYIKSVAITGTGAKPLSPNAIGRYTDFDSTVIGGESEAARKAEQLFAQTFNNHVQASGVNPQAAEVNLFPGVHSGELSHGAGGYISEPMIHWQKVDMINRGRSVVRSSKTGSLIFDNHPDVAPLEGFSPMGLAPHFPLQPDLAAADARGVIMQHVTQSLRESGQNMTQSAILRQEGKHALRVWKTINSGQGMNPPSWIQKLEVLKRNPDISLSSREVDNLWRNFSEYLDLPADLGA